MYLIHPIWFYLYGLVGKLLVVSSIVAITAAIFTLICIMIWGDAYERNREFHANNIKKGFKVTLLFGLLAIGIPSQTTMLQMAAASYATSENVQALAKAGKIVKDELKNDFLEIVSTIKSHGEEQITEEKK